MCSSDLLLKGLNIFATCRLIGARGFFFGSHPLHDSFRMIGNLCDFKPTNKAILLPMLLNGDLLLGIALVVFMLAFEYMVALRSFVQRFLRYSVFVRYSAYLAMLFFILVFGVYTSQEFFYFQF